jgi:hypothetical protein
MILSRERTSVIIIRLWRRRDRRNGLRARITIVRDLEADEADTVVAADGHQVIEIVDRFVNDFAAN